MSDNSTRIYLEGKFWYQLGYTGILRKKGAIYGIKATGDNTQVGELIELTGSGEAPIATVDTPGIVKPDGTSIIVQEDGTISANTEEIKEEVTESISGELELFKEETLLEVDEKLKSVALEIEPI